MRELLTVVLLAVACAPARAPAPAPPALVERLLAAGDHPALDLVRQQPLTFLRRDGTPPPYLVHPQGLAWLPELRKWVVSVAEVIEDRGRGEPGDPNGAGRAYLFFFDDLGRALPDETTELPVRAGAFHPGGIDQAGGHVYVSLSPYVPASRADVLRVPVGPHGPGPAEHLFEVNDHIGIVSFDEARREVLAASWDARRWYVFGLDGRQRWSAPSPSELATQDGQSVRGEGGPPSFVWTGLVNPGGQRFGLDVLRNDERGLHVVKRFRWETAAHRTPAGHPPFQNATHVWTDAHGQVWVAAVPDDQHGHFLMRPHGAPQEAPDVPDPEAGRGASLLVYRLTAPAP